MAVLILREKRKVAASIDEQMQWGDLGCDGSPHIRSEQLWQMPSL